MKNDLLKRLQTIEILPYLSFAAFVLGIKFALIAIYGNATPYWDQWDAEADHLYRPWLEGSLHWMDLFAAHNEHRILTTRLLALGLLELNGKIWDPILQMRVNAVLHVASLSVLLFYLSKTLLSPGSKTALFVFSAVLFSIPFGWENTLAGFQSQFYFLLLFSFFYLWAMSAYKTYSMKWWMGVAAGGLCLVTLASGALTILAGSLILVIRRVVAKDKEGVASSAILLLIAMVVLAIGLTPSIPGHAVLKAQSPTQFLFALATVVSWPANKTGIGVVIVQMPLLLLGLRVLRNREYQTPPCFFIVVMTLWLFGQFVSIAYGRAAGITSSRYLDLFAIGLVLNFSVLIVLLNHAKTQHKLRYGLGIAVWLATVAIGFNMSAGKLSADLQIKAREGLEQEKNVRAYLCSGDIAHLQNKPFLFTPYPNPERLKHLLDNRLIRSILPGNIYELNSRYPIGPDGEPFCDPGSLVRAFEVREWKNIDNTTGLVAVASISNNGWQGTDYFKSSIPGFRVIGSLIKSENDTGMVTLHLRRDDRILYRSGPRVAEQFVLVNNGGAGKFHTILPLALEWSVLEFSNTQLPDEFDVTLIDAGTKWGEWSAIALKVN
ncbi:MAG: hypothetical protein Q8L79_15190 [Methylobacter sp.]|uniref:hypothetical protein n=1 Tax=Methylobacter sp. TaxID=2051955 RepID=UPI00273022DE|nr:hypothetical protein [Methylobacter sp.]MDP1666455.1 hypothetical protein [Methylobacter sp.]